MSWPAGKAYRARFFVPDLSPQSRAALAKVPVRLVFVAESPHVSEVEPEREADRRPLCGKAGRDWWKMIGELVEGEKNDSVDLERLLRLCRQGKIAVLNSVQYPIDPRLGDPVKNLGFAKAGLANYKKLKAGHEVEAAVADLRARLAHSALAGAGVVSLGGDARWFVERALGGPGASKLGRSGRGAARLVTNVPHPSAWWRRGGFFRARAREQLTALLKDAKTPAASRAPADKA